MLKFLACFLLSAVCLLAQTVQPAVCQQPQTTHALTTTCMLLDHDQALKTVPFGLPNMLDEFWVTIQNPDEGGTFRYSVTYLIYGQPQTLSADAKGPAMILWIPHGVTVTEYSAALAGVSLPPMHVQFDRAVPPIQGFAAWCQRVHCTQVPATAAQWQPVPLPAWAPLTAQVPMKNGPSESPLAIMLDYRPPVGCEGDEGCQPQRMGIKNGSPDYQINDRDFAWLVEDRAYGDNCGNGQPVKRIDATVQPESPLEHLLDSMKHSYRRIAMRLP